MEQKAYLISVNMGYGHQRTAFPLRNLAFQKEIINANSYQGIPEKDRKIWEGIRKFYEFISNFHRIPLVGKTVFDIFDRFQKILSFYPRRELSKPNFQLKQTIFTIKKGWGKHLIEKLKQKPLPSQALPGKIWEGRPFITTFFTPAFMAEFFNYPGEIFCIICDADISRTWVSLNPQKSKIRYFAPTERVIERLKLYGVNPENIIFSGYPLPLENIGTEKLEILKEDLKYRILNLDPQKKYFSKYETLIKNSLGELPEKPDHPLTIMFSVGGAGVQKEIGIKIVKSLRKEVQEGRLKIILSAGIREKIKNYFEKEISREKLKENVEILYQEKIENYFNEFNQKLRKTDILWTKPSELSFYAALGIPIIIAPSVGSQEEFNKRWLLKSGFGLLQENPVHTNQWLFDWLDKGYLAEAAMEGFIKGEKLGTLNIKKVVEK